MEKEKLEKIEQEKLQREKMKNIIPANETQEQKLKRIEAKYEAIEKEELNKKPMLMVNR